MEEYSLKTFLKLNKAEKNGWIINEDGNLANSIKDAELDTLDLIFYSDSVEINTEQLTYITLSIKNLNKLKKLIIQAEYYYENSYSDITGTDDE